MPAAVTALSEKSISASRPNHDHPRVERDQHGCEAPHVRTPDPLADLERREHQEQQHRHVDVEAQCRAGPEHQGAEREQQVIAGGVGFVNARPVVDEVTVCDRSCVFDAQGQVMRLVPRRHPMNLGVPPEVDPHDEQERGDGREDVLRQGHPSRIERGTASVQSRHTAGRSLLMSCSRNRR